MRTATVFNFLVEATLIGSALMLVMLLARPFLRRRLGSRALLVAWVLVVLRLAAPLALPNPAMNWLRPTLSQDAGIRPMADQVRVRMEDAAFDLYWKVLGTDTDQTPLHTLLWRAVYATSNGRFARLALTVYGAGAGLSILWMLGQGLLFHQTLRKRRRGGLTPEQQEALIRLCRTYGLRRAPRVNVVAGLPGCCSTPLPRPTILLSAQARPEDIHALLRREVAALRRHDGWWALIRNFCCAVHWFNPLVWAAAQAMRTDAALASDEFALSRCDAAEAQAYAAALIHTTDTCRGRPSIAVAATPATLRDRPMRERVRFALHPVHTSALSRAAFAVCCCFALCLMFGTAEQSSVVNLPAVSACFRPDALVLATEEDAKAYARSFLALEAIDAAEGAFAPRLMEDERGWTAQWYLGQDECLLSFTQSGEIRQYEGGARALPSLVPLAWPITTHSGEGQQWCAFLSYFLSTHLPEIWNAYHAMDIVASGRLDGERYIIVNLLDEAQEPLWQMTVQVAPVGRILSLTPING